MDTLSITTKFSNLSKNISNDANIKIFLFEENLKLQSIILLLEVKENELSVKTSLKEENQIGSIILPFNSNLSQSDFVLEKNILVEKNGLTFQLYPSKTYDLSSIIDKYYKKDTNQFFVAISVYFVTDKKIAYSIHLTTIKSNIDMKKNIIYLNYFFFDEIRKNDFFKCKFQINKKLMYSQKISLWILKFVFNFINKFFSQYSKETLTININSNSTKQQLLKDNFLLCHRLTRNEKIFATAIYFGDEINLNIDSSVLKLSKTCIKENTIISIRKKIKIVKSKNSGLEIHNLVDCKPDGLELKKDVKLIMKSITNNKKAICPKNCDLTNETLNIFDNSNNFSLLKFNLSSFCSKGYSIVWDKDNPINLNLSLVFTKINNRDFFHCYISLINNKNIEV